MGMIESIIEKNFSDGKPFWVAVIDGKEIPCYDPDIKAYKGKENPFEIATSAAGKQYLKTKTGGKFSGKSGGGWKGKSDKELYLQALTMSMAYTKDLIVAEGNGLVIEDLIPLYSKISKAILADLKVLCPEVPVSAPKTPEKPQEKPPQKTSAPRTDSDKEAKTVKEKLEYKMWQYLQNKQADTDQNFKALLTELTEFVGKDGKPVFVDNFDKLSEKWAGSCTGKLEKMIEEEERREIAEADLGKDIEF